MQDFSFVNANKQLLIGRDWPVDTPMAVLALVHGQGEHCGRYAHVAEWFNTRGIALMGFDQQGHGRTKGPRGAAHSLNSLLDDIGLFVEQVKARYPDTPVFLYGHSMGGQLALNYLLRRPSELKGGIITSPWISLAFEPPKLKVLAGKLLFRLTPMLHLPNGLAVRFISRDPEVVKAYQSDPLVHNKIGVGAAMALLEGAEWLQQYAGSSPLPVLLMHGGDDRITSCKASADFASRVANVTWREWPDLYHEMHNERAKEQIFEAMLDFVKSCLDGAK
ncbi:MAG: lysophospholipase [Saprospiraceae bacterium]